ncbi:hypothetical protein GGI25_003133 [Coemansia spiralis]|uniref:Uncharacterized protein n=2 Tax=Coemansia TaxID=4863 RepID=A0A9W8G8R5_9FUNG|nr:hypothetical protein BX070DRAFT_255095 [Coemansia spiralis]KAJ1991751.1 hypothetical protein EDC05_003248 [Coemansia umbellata]KAJ2621744.1 hypothetical protein GGI26_003839 [Coemansia sp. RSA 1358]KAJ2677498.1 hypothetical protein GGI25_003133 [Coemansia spiralis]
MLTGIAHLWLFDSSINPAPTELYGESIGPPNALQGDNSNNKTWFQGHFVDPQTAKQLTLVGVPSKDPPKVHGCMIAEHDTPSYFDLYLCEKAQIAFCAFGVKRHGSGDAMELESGKLTPHRPACAEVKDIRFSTTRMISGDRAQKHLAKYAPSALDAYKGGGDAVVCLGALSIR